MELDPTQERWLKYVAKGCRKNGGWLPVTCNRYNTLSDNGLILGGELVEWRTNDGTIEVRLTARGQQAIDSIVSRTKGKREEIAAYAHEAWSGWMQHLFSKSTSNPDGTVTIPKKDVARWTRQMTTPYAELPESEKRSDRKEADTILKIVNSKSRN